MRELACALVSRWSMTLSQGWQSAVICGLHGLEWLSIGLAVCRLAFVMLPSTFSQSFLTSLL